MATLGALWRDASRAVDRLDARLLLEHVCGCTHADLLAHPERELTAEQVTRFEILLERRTVDEPLSYLLGSAFFYGLEFAVSPDVLIPRPETEVLVDLANSRAQKRAMPRIVDLGTGSGIVAIMLARLCPIALVSAVDISSAALEVARANAARHNVHVRFFEGDWYSPLGDDCFDLIVANPPYVAHGDTHLQQNGLPYEPQVALTDGVAGGDGLACLREIVRGARHRLLHGGWLLMEHGYDQAVQVREMLKVARFEEVASWPDSAGIERVSGGRISFN